MSGSFRELMVQIHDTVPHTVNIMTAGNPPGQPIEVALEAGKTVSFQMPEKICMRRTSTSTAARIRPAAALTSARRRLRSACRTIRIRRSCSAARSMVIPTRRSCGRTPATRWCSVCCISS